MIRAFLKLYTPGYLRALVYMLQASEYHVGEYIRWIRRTSDFSKVMYRRTLVPTKPVKLLLMYLRLGVLLQVCLGVSIATVGMAQSDVFLLVSGGFLVLSYPLLWAYALILPLWIGEKALIAPKRNARIAAAEKIFLEHPGDKIAVLGSYGKTSMKELLRQVLSSGLTVAATPANKNVAISHARFAERLTGKEDVLIIEYGEGEPGDIARFAEISHPDRAIVTGLAPAHLDQYKTLEAAGKDLFSIATFVPAEKIMVNRDSPKIGSFDKTDYLHYSQAGALGWKVGKVKIAIDEMSFELSKGKKVLNLKSGMVGRHLLGSLSLAAALALEYGIAPIKVEEAIGNTIPHEHRMQPFQLAGAWVIDDTYNGNIEGIRAGTALLKELKAKRKIYVTPGLVDQGAEVDEIHEEMGRLIAVAKPDIVVLMRNSAQAFIEKGLEEKKFSGEVRVADDPLAFYQNLDQFVAVGDLVLLQNDWTDNYA